MFIVEGESEKNIIEFLKRKYDVGYYQKINYVLSKELRLSTTDHKENDYKIDKCIDVLDIECCNLESDFITLNI